MNKTTNTILNILSVLLIILGVIFVFVGLGSLSALVVKGFEWAYKLLTF